MMLFILFVLFYSVGVCWQLQPTKRTTKHIIVNGVIALTLMGITAWQLAVWIVEAL